MTSLVENKSKNKLHEEKLDNGFLLLYLHTPEDPITACHIFLSNGSFNEDPEKQGISTLTWSLITKQTRRRSPKDFAEAVDSLGSQISAGTSHDYSVISCHCIAEYFEATLQLMGESLFEAVFDPEEFKKEQTALLAAIAQKKENIFTLSNELLNTHLYPSHSYGRPGSGDEQTVAHIRSADLDPRFKYHLSSDTVIISIASSVPFETALPLLKKYLTSPWIQFPREKPTANTLSPKIQKASHHRQSTSFEQSYLMWGFSAPPVSDSDYMAVKVLNAVLGGGMSARLFMSIRERDGIAYDVGSFYPSRKFGSALVIHAGLEKSKIEKANMGIETEINIIKEQKLPEKELAQIKNYIRGTFILDHQTNNQRANYLGWWQILGLTHEYDSLFEKKLAAVTAEDVLRVAKNILNGPPVTVETVSTP